MHIALTQALFYFHDCDGTTLVICASQPVGEFFTFEFVKEDYEELRVRFQGSCAVLYYHPPPSDALLHAPLRFACILPLLDAFYRFFPSHLLHPGDLSFFVFGGCWKCANQEIRTYFEGTTALLRHLGLTIARHSNA